MRINNKRKNKGRNKRKRLFFFFIIILISILFFSIMVHGEGVFYAVKTFFYKEEALEINIESEKNHDLNDINLSFINEGSCDVYLRGFVFVYSKNKDNNGTTLSNSFVRIKYGDENYWYIGDDDYIYYTKPLNIGNRTEEPMVEGININLSDDDKRLLDENELSIDIVMEAVQVNNFAYKYQWDIEDKELEEVFNNDQNNKMNENLKGKEIIKLIFE